MTTGSDQEQCLIVSDSDGNFYVLSPLVLAQTRVADDRKADIQKLIDGGEVSGYLEPGGSPVPTPGGISRFTTFRPLGNLDLTVARLGGFGVALIQSPIPGRF